MRVSSSTRNRALSPEVPHVSAIVLAAGESTRMGRQKALLPWHGTTLIEYQVAQLATIDEVEQIIVVTGHEPGAISEIYGARLGARRRASEAVAVLDSATTFRVRSGPELVPYPEAYENLAAALLLAGQLALVTGDSAMSAPAALRAERAIAVALELAFTPERAQLAQAIAQFRVRTFVDGAR